VSGGTEVNTGVGQNMNQTKTWSISRGNRAENLPYVNTKQSENPYWSQKKSGPEGLLVNRTKTNSLPSKPERLKNNINGLKPQENSGGVQVVTKFVSVKQHNRSSEQI